MCHEIPPPLFSAVRFAVSWGAQEEQGIWNTWAGFRNTQGFSYKTCHVADREGFATWENQGWVTWVSSVCLVVLSVSRQIIFELDSRLTSGNVSTDYYSFLAHYLSHRSNFSSLSSSIVLIFEFNKLFFNNENNANYLEEHIYIWNIRSMQSPIFGVFV